jgi:hypothetical protein
MAKKPALHRPVKRFKYKVRGIHLKDIEVRKKNEYVVEHQCSPSTRFDPECEDRTQHVHLETVVEYIGIDPENWVRLYPNPGYRRKNGNHWCRKYGKHPMAERIA